MTLSIETLKKCAVGQVHAGRWEEIKDGDFVDGFAPMIDEAYVTDPETDKHVFETQEEAIAGAERFQAKVRDHLVAIS
ncbi:hypothetical protein R6242_21570 [Iodobacter sp. CM08]|uniref:hypothetical protein n=1 Tax=Iodobacter sp. CM08 TaxID=3085902 RepID=UPI002980AD97|nr:hypothetical protein [Iodobacter sp. CM08]MDW5419167.1 hypothetical protein [Iodobacter sp. CM08]